MAARRAPREARDRTDATLQTERRRTDDELLERSTALGEDADEVIRRARERAQAILELARLDEDRALARDGASAEAMADVARDREREDAAERAEHATADAALQYERERRRRAIVQLLALERAETDAMLASERRQADRLVAGRDDTLGAVSHDLRAQLNVLLLSAATIIEQHPDDEHLVHDADLMQRTAAKMTKLIEDLLEVATMEDGRARVALVTADLVALVADEVDTHRAAAEARGVQLELHRGAASIMADVDPVRIGRVLMNLLTNALKFTPAGGRIDVRVGQDGDEVELSVADTGPGIAAAELESIFERFRQIGPARRRTGYGLGLYIARAIVTAHDGRIWAECPDGWRRDDQSADPAAVGVAPAGGVAAAPLTGT